jgi:hypothetical protein
MSLPPVVPEGRNSTIGTLSRMGAMAALGQLEGYRALSAPQSLFLDDACPPRPLGSLAFISQITADGSVRRTGHPETNCAHVPHGARHSADHLRAAQAAPRDARMPMRS